MSTSTDLKPSQLHGAWELTEYLSENASGQLQPALASVTGRLFYSPAGQMAAVISGLQADGEFYQIAYSGAFELREGCVHHQVATATRRGFLGKTLVRQASLEQGLLVLSTLPPTVHRLTWRKL